jgi:hypothetical protein
MAIASKPPNIRPAAFAHPIAYQRSEVQRTKTQPNAEHGNNSAFLLAQSANSMATMLTLTVQRPPFNATRHLHQAFCLSQE